MKMDLQTLCDKVERAIPTAIATPLPAQNQVIVGFMNRHDVEIALLTPAYQSQIKRGLLDEHDYDALLFSLKQLAQ